MNVYYTNIATGTELVLKFTQNRVAFDQFEIYTGCPLDFRFVGTKEVRSLMNLLKVSKSSYVEDIKTMYGLNIAIIEYKILSFDRLHLNYNFENLL